MHPSRRPLPLASPLPRLATRIASFLLGRYHHLPLPLLCLTIKILTRDPPAPPTPHRPSFFSHTTRPSPPSLLTQPTHLRACTLPNSPRLDTLQPAKNVEARSTEHSRAILPPIRSSRTWLHFRSAGCGFREAGVGVQNVPARGVVIRVRERWGEEG